MCVILEVGSVFFWILTFDTLTPRRSFRAPHLLAGAVCHKMSSHNLLKPGMGRDKASLTSGWEITKGLHAEL